jgi:hypothetical protein
MVYGGVRLRATLLAIDCDPTTTLCAEAGNTSSVRRSAAATGLRI